MKSIWLLHPAPSNTQNKAGFKNICYGSFQYAYFKCIYLFIYNNIQKYLFGFQGWNFCKDLFLCFSWWWCTSLQNVQNHQFWDSKSTLGCCGTTEEPWGMGEKKSNQTSPQLEDTSGIPTFCSPISQSFKCKIIYS